MSKIYEALKKAEQDRERTRVRAPERPLPRGDGAERPDPTEEEYQKLRASLISLSVPSGLHTILVTAARHGEGTTTVALGLANALARSHQGKDGSVMVGIEMPVEQPDILPGKSRSRDRLNGLEVAAFAEIRDALNKGLHAFTLTRHRCRKGFEKAAQPRPACRRPLRLEL